MLKKCADLKRLGVLKNSEKRSPWWNQEVKNAVLAKKVAYKAWLQNKFSTVLNSRYTEARKAAALTVKVSKERTWKRFSVKLESD